MFADLLRVYGVDLRHVVSGDSDLTPALVLGLVEELPFGCRTTAVLSGEEGFAGWDLQSFLLASVVDAVREGTFANMQVRTKKKLTPPDPVSRPGVKREKPVNKFLAMARAQLEKEL